MQAFEEMLGPAVNLDAAERNAGVDQSVENSDQIAPKRTRGRLSRFPAPPQITAETPPKTVFPHFASIGPNKRNFRALKGFNSAGLELTAIKVPHAKPAPPEAGESRNQSAGGEKAAFFRGTCDRQKGLGGSTRRT